MKVLVIPDSHLKPNMFYRASVLMMQLLLLQRNIQIHYGVTEIMILVISGICQKRVIVAWRFLLFKRS